MVIIWLSITQIPKTCVGFLIPPLSGHFQVATNGGPLPLFGIGQDKDDGDGRTEMGGTGLGSSAAIVSKSIIIIWLSTCL